MIGRGELKDGIGEIPSSRRGSKKGTPGTWEAACNLLQRLSGSQGPHQSAEGEPQENMRALPYCTALHRAFYFPFLSFPSTIFFMPFNQGLTKTLEKLFAGDGNLRAPPYIVD